MTLVDAIILGSIQGITEFLPISSSGHLVIAQSLLGLKLPGNIIEVVTHLGTLFSVIIVFRKDINKYFFDFKKPLTKKYILCLFIGTIPALIIGFSAKSFILLFFESIKMVSFSLIFTGVILFLSKNRQISLELSKLMLFCLQNANNEIFSEFLNIFFNNHTI